MQHENRLKVGQKVVLCISSKLCHRARYDHEKNLYENWNVLLSFYVYHWQLAGITSTAMLVPIYLCYLLLNGRFILGIYRFLRDYIYNDDDEDDDQKKVAKVKY